MNVEHIPAEDVDMLPCGADWQSRHLESEKRKAEIRDRIHKQAEQGQKTAKDYFRPAKPDRKSTRLNSSHRSLSRMPSSA